MIETSISIFVRMVIGLVFFFSLIAKVHAFASFQSTINKFKILPESASIFLAFFSVVGEFVVTLAMILGGQLLPWGFALAAFMLFIFSIALTSVIIRKIDTPCNCFGSSENDQVSFYEIVRNACFVLCAVVGYFVHPALEIPFTSVVYLYSLMGLSAMALVLIMINLKMIIGLFNKQQ